MNEHIFIILAEESGPGGLFDIGATLPLVAIQFLLLMYVLNVILYNPLITLMSQRNEYILDNLTKASNILLTTSELTLQYETELAITKKNTKKEIIELQKIQKRLFADELDLSQKYIDLLVQDSLDNFTKKKETVLTNLAPEINTLSKQMIKALFLKQT
jgi:F-type H+-transporting ATPase subunit b